MSFLRGILQFMLYAIDRTWKVIASFEALFCPWKHLRVLSEQCLKMSSPDVHVSGGRLSDKILAQSFKLFCYKSKPVLIKTATEHVVLSTWQDAVCSYKQLADIRTIVKLVTCSNPYILNHIFCATWWKLCLMSAFQFTLVVATRFCC